MLHGEIGPPWSKRGALLALEYVQPRSDAATGPDPGSGGGPPSRGLEREPAIIHGADRLSDEEPRIEIENRREIQRGALTDHELHRVTDPALTVTITAGGMNARGFVRKTRSRCARAESPRRSHV